MVLGTVSTYKSFQTKDTPTNSQWYRYGWTPDWINWDFEYTILWRSLDNRNDNNIQYSQWFFCCFFFFFFFFLDALRLLFSVLCFEKCRNNMNICHYYLQAHQANSLEKFYSYSRSYFSFILYCVTLHCICWKFQVIIIHILFR